MPLCVRASQVRELANEIDPLTATRLRWFCAKASLKAYLIARLQQERRASQGVLSPCRASFGFSRFADQTAEPAAKKRPLPSVSGGAAAPASAVVAPAPAAAVVDVCTAVDSVRDSAEVRAEIRALGDEVRTLVSAEMSALRSQLSHIRSQLHETTHGLRALQVERQWEHAAEPVVEPSVATTAEREGARCGAGADVYADAHDGAGIGGADIGWGGDGAAPAEDVERQRRVFLRLLEGGPMPPRRSWRPPSPWAPMPASFAQQMAAEGDGSELWADDLVPPAPREESTTAASRARAEATSRASQKRRQKARVSI